MAQVIFPSVPGLNRLLQVVCEKKMTVLICFLEIKRLVWKPIIIKVNVPGGLGSRGQRLRPLLGHFLAWGDVSWPWGRQPATTLHSASPREAPYPSHHPKAAATLGRPQPVLASQIQRVSYPCRPHRLHFNFSLFSSLPKHTHTQFSLDIFFFFCGEAGWGGAGNAWERRWQGRLKCLFLLLHTTELSPHLGIEVPFIF